MTSPIFPPTFQFGAATSSYQIEGAIREGGRGPSIWDVFCDQPGAIQDGSSGAVTSDHYHRMEQDVALMAQLGLEAYRFSIAWPRIQPQGRGVINQPGLDFYQRLVDQLRLHGIKPVVTLYHWDLPQTLEEAGGWPNRDTAYYFADYAAAVAHHLGDRVDSWITVNEPWCAALLGYGAGVHAPGRQEPAEALAAAHHLNLGHGLAAQAVRSEVAGARLAVALNPHVLLPASESPDDIAATRAMELVGNELFLQPLLEGHYPAELLGQRHVTDWGFIQDGDLGQIHQPLSYLAVNYYMTWRVAHQPGQNPGGAWVGVYDAAQLPAVPPITAMGWNIDPTGLTRLLTGLHQRYPQVPLVVSENGSAFADTVAADGAVHDPQRVDYLRGHLAALAEVVAAGVPVEGYFAWSLMDNFEWAEGYRPRFGLFYVDYATGERIWKDSARFYAEVIRHREVTNARGR
ncbi:MAG: beta-glucosidase [Bifidobacteriaceae bacterium]|jgi:beta-glucosidase|nr:beta-glucosidase [Bifidobacteriaceae bacterium]